MPIAPWWPTAAALHLFDTSSGKLVHTFAGNNGPILAVAPSPDGARHLLAAGDDQILHLWDTTRREQLLSLCVINKDWIAWTPEGYYAASPSAERFMGWTVNNGLDQLATFYPAERFRKQLFRPDVVKLVLVKGSLAQALKYRQRCRREQAGGPGRRRGVAASQG